MHMMQAVICVDSGVSEDILVVIVTPQLGHTTSLGSSPQFVVIFINSEFVVTSNYEIILSQIFSFSDQCKFKSIDI